MTDTLYWSCLDRLTEATGTWTPKIPEIVAHTLAAARREGVEHAIAALHAWARDRSYIDIADPDDWERVLRALPLAAFEPEAMPG